MNIKEIAKKSTQLNPLIDGLEKIDTEDLTAMEYITIEQFCVVKVDDENSVYAYTIKELPKNFAFAGTILSNMFFEIVTNFNGDIEKANAQLKKENGIKIKLTTRTSNKNKNYTHVQVLD